MIIKCQNIQGFKERLYKGWWQIALHISVMLFIVKGDYIGYIKIYFKDKLPNVEYKVIYSTNIKYANKHKCVTFKL